MPRLTEPLTLTFNYGISYDEWPVIPVRFSSQGINTIVVLCLVDSGASGVLLPTEIASELGLDLPSPTVSVTGVAGTGHGSLYNLSANLLETDGQDFPVDMVFLPELPVAILGRSPFFERYNVGFQHSGRNLYFNLI